MWDHQTAPRLDNGIQQQIDIRVSRRAAAAVMFACPLRYLATNVETSSGWGIVAARARARLRSVPPSRIIYCRPLRRVSLLRPMSTRAGRYLQHSNHGPLLRAATHISTRLRLCIIWHSCPLDHRSQTEMSCMQAQERRAEGRACRSDVETCFAMARSGRHRHWLVDQSLVMLAQKQDLCLFPEGTLYFS